MKNILIIATYFFFSNASAQNNKPTFDGKKWEAPYTLDIPKGWGVERFLMPIEFAPAITYKGVEDIRFSPGWSKAETDKYWTYAFLWYLDSKPTFDSKIIEKNLMAYYTGLFNVNVDKNKIDTSKLATVQASIKETTVYKGDLKTFQGTVHINDFISKQPLLINLIIHIKLCEGQNKTFVFYEVSPKPFTDNVWNSLNQLWTDFKCVKN